MDAIPRVIGSWGIRLLAVAAVFVSSCEYSALIFAEDDVPRSAPHPLDPALKEAYERLEYIKNNVQDYTCTIFKRERIKGELGGFQSMDAKIRNRKEVAGKVEVPLSVYLNFRTPSSVAGREVIWVEGRNEGNLIVHEAGLLNIKRLSLPPTGYLAMMGQRYPITEIGMQKLLEELIKKGERDRKRDECQVQFFDHGAVDKRPCRMIQVIHPERRDYFDFHKVQIQIDKELGLPVRYAAWTWPEKVGGEPVLEEEYIYTNVELNVGLTDEDFSPDNASYNYPKL